MLIERDPLTEHPSLSKTPPVHSPASQPTATPCFRKKGSLTTFQAQLLKKLDTNTTDQDDQDADKLFLMSLLPELKSMHEDDKYDFRICTLQLMKDLKRKRSTQAAVPTSFYHPIPGSSAQQHHGPPSAPHKSFLKIVLFS